MFSPQSPLNLDQFNPNHGSQLLGNKSLYTIRKMRGIITKDM
jgi:hypothetical protein